MTKIQSAESVYYSLKIMKYKISVHWNPLNVKWFPDFAAYIEFALNFTPWQVLRSFLLFIIHDEDYTWVNLN